MYGTLRGGNVSKKPIEAVTVTQSNQAKYLSGFPINAKSSESDFVVEQDWDLRTCSFVW